MSDVTEYDFDPYNLPKDLLAAIGLVITAASQAETIMGMGIGGCLGIDTEYQMAVTTHMPVPLKFSILRSAAEIRLSDLDALDELDNLLDTLKSALEKRNYAAHSSYCRHPSGSIHRVEETARVRLEAHYVPTTTKSVQEDARAIHQASLALMTFLMRQGLLPLIPMNARPRGHKSKAARKQRTQLKK